MCKFRLQALPKMKPFCNEHNSCTCTCRVFLQFHFRFEIFSFFASWTQICVQFYSFGYDKIFAWFVGFKTGFNHSELRAVVSMVNSKDKISPLISLNHYIWSFLIHLMCSTMYRTYMYDYVILYLHVVGVYFTWSLRKQAAYKQATRGPTALSPFRGTRQWG